MATAVEPSRTTWKVALCLTIVVFQTLTAGSIFTYPLFGPTLSKALDLTMQETSTIASLAMLSQYATAALWGSLADRRGAASVSFGAATFFVAGYLLMSSTLDDALDPSKPALRGTWIWVAVFYMLPGSATAASYFSAVSTSARLFPSRPGLAIGVPCAIFGLSPLFLSFIGDAAFRVSHGDRFEDTFDAVGYLWMLGALLGGINLVGAIGLHFGARTQAAGEVPSPSRQERTTSVGEDGFDEAPTSRQAGPLTEETPLLSRRESEGETKDMPKHAPIADFLKDPGMWTLGVIVLLCAGPGEMTMASLGGVIGAIVPSASRSSTVDGHPPSALVLRARHVQVVSAVNTVSRLGTGWASDWLARPGAGGGKKVSRLSLLAASAGLYAAACFFTAFALEGSGGVWVLSVSTGLCYGAAFTLVPSIVASIWPLADFGRNWGLLSYFSATGSFLYTLLFGVLYDAARHDGSCTGRSCFMASYVLAGASEAVALALTAVLWTRWRDRV